MATIEIAKIVASADKNLDYNDTYSVEYFTDMAQRATKEAIKCCRYNKIPDWTPRLKAAKTMEHQLFVLRMFLLSFDYGEYNRILGVE